MNRNMDAFVPGFISGTWPGDRIDSQPGPPPLIDRAGDLVVAGGTVRWTSPAYENEGGGRSHPVPDGTYPVYAGSVPWEDEDNGPRYYVTSLFIPLAEPGPLAASSWDDGYDGGGPVFESYACLWSERASRATLPHWGDDRSEFLLRTEKELLSGDALSRRGNWTDEVVDPETGANVLAFPVYFDISMTGFEARGEDGRLVGLLFTTW
ncbi:hypothetical protein ACFYYH_05230 [Streptomyces sp. NPDC002018]|uniref:hypothetical protein n=1 Tax=Streptomyces sp. NPDC002018 TaxID=3364629 RepID=UPI00367C2FDE